MGTKNILLILAISGILAACGSSSSQGTTESTSGTTSSSSTGGATSSGTTSSGTTTLNGLQVTNDNNDTIIIENFTTDSLDAITIDGTKITLVPKGVGPSYHTDITDPAGENGYSDQRIYSGTEYQYSRFAYLDIYGQGAVVDDAWGMLSYGEVTETMPTKGSANYKGGAIGQMIESGNDEVAITAYGVTDLNVTFGDGNKVTGTIGSWEREANFSSSQTLTASDMPTYTIDATISGNTFSQNSNGIQAKGQFYGPNAEELGGVLFADDQRSAASFGAIKQ